MKRGRDWGCISAAALVVLAGCGGGTRQDAQEPTGNYKVQIVDAKFPASQQLATSTQMSITVRNADTRAIPNVGITVDSFTRRAVGTADADPTRPIWIVDRGPSGGDTAYRGTWALGTLPVGQSRTFKWKLTAVDPGMHDVHYRVDAGLNGKAVAKLDGGGDPLGDFKVTITGSPSSARVDPNTGRVIRSPAPSGGGSGGSSGNAGGSTGGPVVKRTTPNSPPPGY